MVLFLNTPIVPIDMTKILNGPVALVWSTIKIYFVKQPNVLSISTLVALLNKIVTFKLIIFSNNISTLPMFFYISPSCLSTNVICKKTLF